MAIVSYKHKTAVYNIMKSRVVTIEENLDHEPNIVIQITVNFSFPDHFVNNIL